MTFFLSRSSTAEPAAPAPVANRSAPERAGSLTIAPRLAGRAAPPALVLDDVRKSFRLPHQRFGTLKERVLHPLAALEYDELRAVVGVSVRIA